jgi:hypothetical protein
MYICILYFGRQFSSPYGPYNADGHLAKKKLYVSQVLCSLPQTQKISFKPFALLSKAVFWYT